MIIYTLSNNKDICILYIIFVIYTLSNNKDIRRKVIIVVLLYRKAKLHLYFVKIAMHNKIFFLIIIQIPHIMSKLSEEKEWCKKKRNNRINPK